MTAQASKYEYYSMCTSMYRKKKSLTVILLP